MAEPRAFISFDFDNDEGSRKYFVGQSINQRVPFTIEDWSSKEELIQSQWESIIKAKINKCHLMVILVGQSTSKAVGVAKEITFAQAHDIPFFGVYVNEAGKSTPLPTGLARSRTIDWTWDGVKNAIEQMMKEGKNAS